jgi:hypothetical protein
MKIDCRWFGINLEAYFCETLGEEDLRLAAEHLKTCLNCRKEVQALNDIDPLVKQVLEFRMTKAEAAARAPRRSVPFQLGLAGAALALTGGLAFLVFSRQTGSPTVPQLPSSATASNTDSPVAETTKTDDSTPTLRTKPDAPGTRPTVSKPGPEPVIPDNAPEFRVSFPEGYSTNLQDYKGRVLVVGVWSSDQPEAVKNLQKLYQAFGTRREVQILGASTRRLDRPAGTTFPMVFNNGSRLLETRTSNLVVVDKEGNVQMRDSLIGDSGTLVAKVKTKLDELGGK